MSEPCLILDLGVGNLGNVARAVTAVGGAPELSSDPARIRAARRLLLPGVGAFRPPREALRGELEAALHDALAAGAWLLGICVGYQLLFESSAEFGELDGLALLPGRVTELPATAPRPHIGWNRLSISRTHPLVDGIDDGAFVYFVHSFAVDAANAADGQETAGADAMSPATPEIATTNHGRRFASIAGRDRVLGAQFHPEKSGAAGLRLLGNFLTLPEGAGTWS